VRVSPCRHQPEEAVRLLGQLRREWCQHEGKHERLEARAVSDVEDFLDEDVGAADDRAKRDEKLDDHRSHRRRVRSRRIEDQRPQLVDGLDLAAVP
jgi:hypothetical protein